MLSGVISSFKKFLELKSNKPLKIIAYPNTDGIVSSAILAKTFREINKKFVIGFSKRISQENFNKDQQEGTILIDSKSDIKNINENNFIIQGNEKNSASEISYLLSREMIKEDIGLSDLAIIGLIAEQRDVNASEISKSIINNSKNLEIKKGLTIYPATRPLKRSLQLSTSPYIPGVTGNEPGVMELLKETRIDGEKSLLDLDESEMSRLALGIRLRQKGRETIQKNTGEIYILKIFNKKEDVREIATILNSCSKQGFPDIALSYCLGDKNSKSIVLDIYTRHTQEIVSGLKIAENLEKIDNGGMIILNARDQIKDIIVGTICSMLSTSPKFKEGTILIGMAYNQDKLKVSARIVGRTGKNLKEFLEKTVINFKNENPKIDVEVGGHEFAAGCILDKSKEKEFIEALKKSCEIEFMKV